MDVGQPRATKEYLSESKMTLKEELKQKSGRGVFQAVERTGTEVQSRRQPGMLWDQNEVQLGKSRKEKETRKKKGQILRHDEKVLQGGFLVCFSKRED